MHRHARRTGCVALLVVLAAGCTRASDTRELEAQAVAAEQQASQAERAAAERAEAERAQAEAEVERLAAEEEARRAEEERLAAEAEERLAREEAERVAAEEEARRAEEEARRAEEERLARIVTTQERLAELGYLVGAVDGEQGQQTTAAIMAFQAVNGLQVDGVIGPQTLAALDAPAAPSLRGGPDRRIEVDLDRQVLHLVEGGTRVVTMKVSSGNGAPYEVNDGSSAVGDTPVGTFRIERRIRGVRESNLGLGTLYDPMYFHLGYAIHGSNNVPAGPASHGCVRLSRADAVWLFDRVPDGTTIQLYGGRHVFSP